MRRTLLVLLAVLLAGAFAQAALAGGGSYAFAGGTAREQATVRAALNASSFDWGVLPQRVTVHIGTYGSSWSTYGEAFLDASLLDAGRFAWGTVQHELAHQVDFQLLDPAKRALLQQQLGGGDWCYEDAALPHDEHACERFASTLAWAFWPSADNTNRASAALPAASFRALLGRLLPLAAQTFGPRKLRR